MNATIIVAKCSNTGKYYGIRSEQHTDGSWWITWTFPLSEEEIQHEHYGHQIKINTEFHLAKTYTGCPYCGSTNFASCGNCHKISCSPTLPFTCPWCGCEAERFSNDHTMHVTGGDL